MHLSLLLLFYTSLASGVPTLRGGSYNLLTLDPTVDTSNFPACQGKEVISCAAATVNWDSLKNPDENTIILPTGDEMFEASYIQQYGFNAHDFLGDLPISFQYKNQDGAEAVLTYKGNSLYGDIELGAGGDFLIEKYNDEYVLWIRVDQTVYKDKDPIVEPAGRALPHMRMEEVELREQGQADRDTVVEYSVTVYYTAGLKASTADVGAYVDQVIAETNVGYINSEIPLRVKLHCLLESSIPDGLDADTTLNTFADSESSNTILRRSADATILLVDHFDDGGICGVNFFDRISDGHTIGTVMKSCALGYFSFGHEIAHGLGLQHDRYTVSTNIWFMLYNKTLSGYAYGHTIELGLYRSIMAYSRYLETRINYYSNPDVIYKRSKWAEAFPTGTQDANNARVLRERRFAIAKIGDESMQCSTSRANFEGQCHDETPRCVKYASEGRCSEEPMAVACPIACGLCSTSRAKFEGQCHDETPRCVKYASEGKCSWEPMAVACPIACGLCSI